MKIETKDGTIVLKEVFSGVLLETEEGNQIVICMRDDTFELQVIPKNIFDIRKPEGRHIVEPMWHRADMRYATIAPMGCGEARSVKVPESGVGATIAQLCGQRCTITGVVAHSNGQLISYNEPPSEPGYYRAGDIELHSEYWDCECEEGYIRPKSEPACRVCGQVEEDMPESRGMEVRAMLKSLEGTKSIVVPDSEVGATITKLASQRCIVVTIDHMTKCEQMIHYHGPDSEIALKGKPVTVGSKYWHIQDDIWIELVRQKGIDYYFSDGIHADVSHHVFYSELRDKLDLDRKYEGDSQ